MGIDNGNICIKAIMKFGNTDLSGWMYFYHSYSEGELGNISWFIFDRLNLPTPHSIVDLIAASVVTADPVIINDHVVSWLVTWKDDLIGKLYHETRSGTPMPDVEDVKNDIDNFLIRMSNLLIFT